MAENRGFVPDYAAMADDRMQKFEHEVVQRILQRAELGHEAAAVKSTGPTHLLTFQALTMVTGFPLQLGAVQFKTKQLAQLDLDLDKRPGRSKLFHVFDENRPDDHDSAYGIVFSWASRGKFVFTDKGYWSAEATQGRWWTINGKRRVLLPLDAFIDACGPSEDW